jgi:hypothetical protein
MTKGELLSRMSSHEMTEWRAYFGHLHLEREMNKSGGSSGADFAMPKTMTGSGRRA